MTINQYGLISNIIGTIIIAFVGLPNYYYSKGGGSYLVINSSEEGKKFNRRKKVLAWVGILFIIAGFSLEFLATLGN